VSRSLAGFTRLRMERLSILFKGVTIGSWLGVECCGELYGSVGYGV
jgi:hypothetical protein